MTHDLLEVLDRIVILEVVGVGDLPWSPFSLVIGVVDHWGIPLAPVGRVGLHWLLPLTTPSSISTLGVGNGRSNPIAILLLIPLLGLLRVGVRDSLGFIIEPALRLDGILVDNLVGSVVIPVIRLHGKLDQRGRQGRNQHVPW
jgi:hypothetical protein